jgi:hypothetical protein
VANDNQIVINIGGDPKGFEKAVEQVQSLFKGLGKTVDNESKTSSAAFSSFIGNFASATALNAIGAVRDAIGAVFGKIQGGIKDALEADVALKKFNLALANSGQFSQTASDSFEEFADKFEKSSGVSSEAVLGVASKIQAFGNLTVPELQRATKAAGDLSAATGVDFETAGSLFAKASQGNVEALKKLGVQVENTGNAQLDFSNALNQVERQFGGSAENAVKNFSGQIKLLGIAYEDTFKTFGQSITDTPALTGLASGFTGVFNSIKVLIEENQTAIQEFVSGGVNLLIDSLQGIGNTVAFGFEAFGAFREILVNVNTAILAIPEAAFKVGAAFATIFAPLDAIISAFNQLTGSNIPQIKASFQSIGDEIGAFRDFAKQEAQEFTDAQTVKADAIRNFASTSTETLRASVAEQTAITDEQRALELERRSAQAAEDLEAKELTKQAILADLQNSLTQSQGFLTQTEAAELESQTRKLVNEKKFLDAKALLRKNDEITAKKSADLAVKIETEKQAASFDVLNAGLGLASALTKGKSKEIFLLQKAAAIAQTLVATEQAATLALAQPPGPPTTLPLAAAARGKGLASVASIVASSIGGFANGGLVSGGIPGIDSVPILAQQGEIVAPPKSFDEVVEGTARQRGFVQGNENAGVIAKLDELLGAITGLPSVTIQAGTLVADENGINALADALRDAVQFRGATLA